MATTTNVGQSGEKLRIDKDTFEVIGVDSGKILAQGSSLTEALALQTQLQSGSAPSLKGAPDVFAVEPTAAQEVVPLITSTGEEIDPRVATQEELSGEVPVTSEFIEAETADQPIQIRSRDDLNDPNSLASLAEAGLTEDDIIRQGQAIFLKPGITRDVLSARGTQAGADQVTAGTGDFVPFDTAGTTATDIATQQTAAERNTIFGEVMGDPSIAEQEGQLLQTIGEGIMEQDRALRELPSTIQERTEKIGVTQAQLNRLVATEREPIAQALKDLLMSRSLLQEQIAFRREEAALLEEQQDRSFNKMLEAGVGDSAFFAQLDEAQGLPAGVHQSMFDAQTARNAQEAYIASLDVADKVVGILKDVPLGTPIEIGGNTYTGFSTDGMIQGTEKDNLGNVTAFAVNPITGEKFSIGLGQIGASSGLNENGNPLIGDSGQLMYTNGLYEVFPDGSFGGECGEWVHEGVDIGPVGDSFNSKMKAIEQSTANMGLPGFIEPEDVQVMDLFVQNIGSYGHIGFVNDKRFNESTSKWEFRVSESNRGLDKKVTHGKWLTEDQIAGFGRAPIKPGMEFGTGGDGGAVGDGIGSNLTSAGQAVLLDLASQYKNAKTPAEKNAVLSQTKTLGLSPADVVAKSTTTISTPESTQIFTGDISKVATTPQGKTLSGLIGYKESINRYITLINEVGSAGSFSPGQRSRLDSARTDVLLAIKDAEQLGALQAPDIEVIEGKLPDLTRKGFKGLLPKPFAAGRAVKVLKEELKTIESKASSNFNQLLSINPGLNTTDYARQLSENLGIELPTTVQIDTNEFSILK